MEKWNDKATVIKQIKLDKIKCGDWLRQWPKWNVNAEQRDEVGVACKVAS